MVRVTRPASDEKATFLGDTDITGFVEGQRSKCVDITVRRLTILAS